MTDANNISSIVPIVIERDGEVELCRCGWPTAMIRNSSAYCRYCRSFRLKLKPAFIEFLQQAEAAGLAPASVTYKIKEAANQTQPNSE